MWWLWIVIGIVILIGLAAGVSYYTYRIAFYVPEKRKENIYDIPDDEQYAPSKAWMVELIDEMKALPFEQVYITSKDGLKLSARYYHVCDEAPLQLQFHGYRGTAYRDFCGGNKLAREMGHNTLVIDQRAHGNSEGKTITFGIKEREDCLCWLEYACQRFGREKPIYLSGVSMGAATVLTACGLELPNNVKGVIADSPFSSPAAIIRKVCREMGFPPKLAFPFLRLGARLYGGFDLLETSAVEGVKKARVPVLIIHGEDDRFVPCEMSEEIFKACASKKTRATFPKAGHGISYIVDPKRYEKTVKEFLSECEREQKAKTGIPCMR